MEYRKLRVIISGGGTGGHIFPALSIAGELRRANPETEILFVGAEGKMEMQKVPAAGYPIKGLPISGLRRGFGWTSIRHNAGLPVKIASSISKARRIIREFRPDVVVGVGGYASAPLLWAAQRMKVPTLIQEQNGFAGLTNRILASHAGTVCVAYEGMERFFPADRIVISGNPIRETMHPYTGTERQEALRHFGMTDGKRHLLVVGGSLGCGTLNRAMMAWIEAGMPGGEDVEVLWQCGSHYKKEVDDFMSKRNNGRVQWSDFISNMDMAFAAADLVISRSGASSISEICATGKSAIFVPSPNVAEDHQTHNAMALVCKGAAKMVPDAEAAVKLMPLAMELIHNSTELEKIGAGAAGLARPDAGKVIVDEIYKLI